MIKRGNLFANIPQALPKETFELLHESGAASIHRILSRGQSAPEEGWFDQETDEWVALLAGKATLLLQTQGSIDLQPGDWLLIPAHTRHRVTRTSMDDTCVWLAIHMCR